MQYDPTNSYALESSMDKILYPYAVKYQHVGRKQFADERDETYRTRFRRDRDRILYSIAFRRLQYKTQVFVSQTYYIDGNGDPQYRSRLTHTLEVEQLATSICNALRLNHDLAGAIALGHDIGHTPFGHSVESILNEFIKDQGGFSHSVQSVRCAEHLEQRNGKDGLELCQLVREGILKHDTNGYFSHERQWNCEKLKPDEPGSLEMQVVYWADKIAYVTHDWDDFVASGIAEHAIRENVITIDDLLELWRPLIKDCKEAYDKVSLQVTDLSVRDLIRNINTSLIKTSNENLNKYKPESPEQARLQTSIAIKKNKDQKPFHSYIINFDDDYREAFLRLQYFLIKYCIGSPTVKRMDQRAKDMVLRVLEHYNKYPKLLPWRTQEKMKNSYEPCRVLIDHVACMTDVYAARIYRELFSY